MADINIKARYIIVGEKAPKNSRFKGVVTVDKIFGSASDTGIKSYFEYTARESAKDESLLEKESSSFSSLLDYTSRLTDSNNATFTHLGYLSTPEKIERFVAESKQQLNQKGSCIYDLVISFKSFEDAARYGIKTNQDWSKKIYKLIPKLAIKLGFDPSNVGYWMDYHSKCEKGKTVVHPHIHLAFFEKVRSKEAGHDNLTKATLKMLKREIVKYIMLEDNLKYQFEKIDNLKKEIRKIFSKVNLKNNVDVLKLLSQLPVKGRLQYNSIHIKPFRKQLDNLANQIINQNQQLKTLYEKFIKVLEDYDRCISESNQSELSNIKENELNKFKEFVANQILSYKKNIPNHLLETVQDFLEQKNPSSNELIQFIAKHLANPINLPANTLLQELSNDTIALDVTTVFLKQEKIHRLAKNNMYLDNHNLDQLKKVRLAQLRQKAEYLLFIRAMTKRIGEIEKEIELFISGNKEF